MKVVILGIDGATFNIIDPLIEKGKLPNVKKIIENGFSGNMKSTASPESPPAWTSLITGVNPGQHGIYDFLKVTKDYQVKLNLSYDRKAKPFWEILDIKSIIVNIPLTYPPDHEIMIGDMLSPGLGSDFVKPKELKKEILENIKGYKITVDWELYQGKREEFLIDLKKMIRARLELFEYLMKNKEWDLFFGVEIATDRLQHLFWGEEELTEVYGILDEYIGNLIERDITLFIVSDHGFGEVKEVFYMNEWLKENHYLTIKENRRLNLLRKLGINKENISLILKKLKIDVEGLRMRLPEKIKNSIPASKPSLFQSIDWKNSKCFFYGIGNVFINKKSRFSLGNVENVEELKEELKEKLLALEFIKQVYDGEEVYKGSEREFAPDLVVELKEGYSFGQSLNKSWLDKAIDRKADHLPEGICLAYGKHIKKDKADLEIIDFAPTIMYYFTDKLENKMEGQVKKIFKRVERKKAKREEDKLNEAISSINLNI